VDKAGELREAVQQLLAQGLHGAALALGGRCGDELGQQRVLVHAVAQHQVAQKAFAAGAVVGREPGLDAARAHGGHDVLPDLGEDGAGREVEDPANARLF